LVVFALLASVLYCRLTIWRMAVVIIKMPQVLISV
jgi:hypothetical protein